MTLTAKQDGPTGWRGRSTFRLGSGAPFERLADQLYERIVSQIVSGTLPTGERLPPRARLCDIFGASRPIVREAIIRLQADGLVVTRHGAGTCVARAPEG